MDFGIISYLSSFVWEPIPQAPTLFNDLIEAKIDTHNKFNTHQTFWFEKIKSFKSSHFFISDEIVMEKKINLKKLEKPTRSFLANISAITEIRVGKLN